jgi:Co/Zn/Cd efflux system component
VDNRSGLKVNDENEREPLKLFWALLLNMTVFFSAIILLVIMAVGSYALIRDFVRWAL